MNRNPFGINAGLDKKLPHSKDLSFDEAYLDAQASEPSVLDNEKDSVNMRFLASILIIGFLALSGRIYLLQIVKGQEYRDLAEGNKLRIQYVLAPRGLILDSSGKVIAGNIPSFELVVDPSALPTDPSQLLKQVTEIAAITARDTGELFDLVGKMDRNVFGVKTLVQNLTKDQALTLMAKQDSLTAFAVQNNSIRDYKDPEVFSHLVGYTGKITADELTENEGKSYLLNDYIGKTGLEIHYEQDVRGIPGRKQIEIDASGNFKKNLPELPAKPGNNLKLNIDYDLQKVLYDSMLEVMGRGSAKKAAAVATNPKTGAVLAFISLPGFDNNLFARGISTSEYQALANDKNVPFLNRVVSGTYPPGSTVKPMLAIAALTEGTITTQTKILDDGVIRVGNFTFYGYDPKGLGYMDVYSAIAKSSDIFFYTVGGGNPKSLVEGLGPERLAQWYRKFGLGEKLGIDIPNEKTGLVPDPAWKEKTRGEQWYLGNTYHFAIGQGDLLVTPLQVNSWTATIANGGKIMEPYIVDEVEDLSGTVVRKNEPQIVKENFLDPQWVKVAQDGMRQTVTLGSARSLNGLPLEIAGKTGTAQFDAGNLARTHAWFTSYAPFSDPQIALTVLVESGGEGSSVAVPITKTVYEWWAANRYNK